MFIQGVVEPYSFNRKHLLNVWNVEEEKRDGTFSHAAQFTFEVDWNNSNLLEVARCAGHKV